MEEIPRETPGVGAGVQGGVMIQELAVKPEQVLAANIRSAREQKGMTQKHVAQLMALLGFKWQHTTVARLEAGQRPIRVNEAFSLSAVLGVNIVRLLGLGEFAQQARIVKSMETLNDLQALQAQVLEFVTSEERKHRNGLRNYLLTQLDRLDALDEGRAE